MQKQINDIQGGLNRARKELDLLRVSVEAISRNKAASQKSTESRLDVLEVAVFKLISKLDSIKEVLEK